MSIRNVSILIIAVAAATAGCQKGGVLGRQSLEPGDFTHHADGGAAAPASSKTPTQTEQPRAGAEAPAPDEDAAALPADPAAPDTALASPTAERTTTPTPTPAPAAPVTAADKDLTIDAKVGDIYGKPVYAGEVFSEIGEDQLARLGQIHPRLEFRERAAALIRGKLNEWLYNKLLIAEAESALSDRERQSLPGIRHIERERLIAKYGGGVPAIANQALIRERGYGVEEAVNRHTQVLILRKYRDEKIMSKVSVNRREVERYYRDHPHEFNPTPSVTLRLIVARDTATADKIDSALAAGTPFAEVAQAHSAFRAEDGGLLPPFQLEGPVSEFDELQWGPVNEKVRGLSPGEHSDRTPVDGSFYWVMLEDLQAQEPRTLQEVYLEIEKKLREDKEQRLHKKLMAELFRHGNYTPFEQMSVSLLDVAMVRYARQQ